MKKWIWIGVVAVVVIFFYATYNGFVNKEEGLKTAWSNVETQYQRRADLIPNLVNTVKGYAAHESQTFEAVTRPEGQPEFPRTASAARRHREPYFSGPQGVQRGGQDLQRRRAPLPGQPGGQVVRVRAEALLRGCRRYRNRTPGAVLARLRGRKQRDGTRQRIPSLLCCRCLPTCGFRESGAGRGTG